MKKIAIFFSVFLLGTVASAAYIRTQLCDTVLSWASGSWPLSFIIAAQDPGGNSVSAANQQAIRTSFAIWEEASGSQISFTEVTDGTLKASVGSWCDTDKHYVIFISGEGDATCGSDDPSTFLGSTTLAITSTLIAISGSCPATNEILDADIFVNSETFTFSTHPAGQASTYDLQSIVTHEIGHFIGLDHSPIGNSTMFPLAAQAEVVKRSLATDDLAGAANVRPPSSTNTGTISGTIRNLAGVATKSHPHVVALDANGNVASAVFGGVIGTYTLNNLAAGNYTVYATPFLGVLEAANITDDMTTIDTNFSMTFYPDNSSPTTVVVTAGAATTGIDINVNNVITGPVEFTGPATFRGILVQDDSQNFTLNGSDLDSLSASDAAVSGSDVTITFPLIAGTGSSSVLSVLLTADASASKGARDISIDDAGMPLKIIVWPGAIEVVNAAPTIDSLDVTTGESDGGDTVVITGTNFQGNTTTLKVFFGADQGTVTAVSAAEVTVTTPATTTIATVNLNLINADGQGARLAEAFTYTASTAPSGGGGGGGGCCAIRKVGPPPPPSDILGLLLPFIFLFIFTLILRRRRAIA